MSKHSNKQWSDFFTNEFANESDRASVILAAAMLDQAVETLLRAGLVPNSSQSDPLFEGPYAPGGSFSAKIEIAYRVGIISRLEAKNLNLIRKIRNQFAHNVTGCSFEDASVHSRVVELVKSAGVVSTAQDIRDGYIDGLKGDFQMTISWLIWSFWSRNQI